MYFTHFCRWKSESRVPAVSSSTENPLLVSNCQLLVVFSRGRKRARKLSGVPFIRALISFNKAQLSWPDHFSKVLLPSTITMWVRISSDDFWKGHKYSVPCTLPDQNYEMNYHNLISKYTYLLNSKKTR